LKSFYTLCKAGLLDSPEGQPGQAAAAFFFGAAFFAAAFFFGAALAFFFAPFSSPSSAAAAALAGPSTSCISAIGAASPGRGAMCRMRVYPPGRDLKRGPRSVNSLATTSASRRRENARRRLASVSKIGRAHV